MKNKEKTAVEHEWWWIAINGSSCAAAPMGSRDDPTVIPTPEKLIGYQTQEEQLTAQQLILTEPNARVSKYMNSLAGRIESGRIRYIRPEHPEPPTTGFTQWIVRGKQCTPENPAYRSQNPLPNPTMRSLVPKEVIEPLKKLGQTEWVRIVTDSSRHRLVFDHSIFETLKGYPAFLNALVSQFSSDGSLLLEFLAYSKVLANGPKIVQPTSEQCEALAHVDLNLKFREYEQPFPAFVVQVPAEIQRQLTNEYSLPCPQFVIPFHDRSKDFLTVICVHGSGDVRGGVVTVFSRNSMNETMEASLQRFSGGDGRDYEQARVLERIALNLSLLLTRYGFQDAGPLDRKAFEKQSKLAKSTSERKRQRARRLLDSSFRRISLSQEVKFVNKTDSVSQFGDSEGSLKSPHWRRGHFRRARVGVGRSETRLVFVRPSFINAQHFEGDLADTQYRIRTDKAEVASSGETNAVSA